MWLIKQYVPNSGTNAGLFNYSVLKVEIIFIIWEDASLENLRTTLIDGTIRGLY